MTPRQRKEVDASTYSGRFAIRLRELRDMENLSIEEVSKKSGIPVKTIYNWEQATRMPHFDMLPKIANSINVSVRLLMPEE